jgi:hypothetical protein
MAWWDSENPLEAEIRQEKAEAYFAACRKMTAALEAFHDFDRLNAGSELDAHQQVRRAELVREAAKRVHYVVIQREALNLSCPPEFFEAYSIPEEIRAGMGSP